MRIMSVFTALLTLAVLLVVAAQPATAKDSGRSVRPRGSSVIGKAWANDSSESGSDGGRHTSSRSVPRNVGPNSGAASSTRGWDYILCTFACAPAARTVDPQVVAREAVARLRLTAPKPAIGPPPSINRWKMAAVGYPLWLWVDGNTNPAPVTDSDGPLSVTLDARVTSIGFAMGDGHTLTCASTGTRWTQSVPAGQPSPTCGYRYTKPSLPEGNYTVTATTHWAIDWNINGTTGTIPYTQTSSIAVPVGELQVLVR